LPAQVLARGTFPSLNILSLLAHLFDQQFQIDRRAGHFDTTGLGAQGVGLAIHFLEQEVESFAHAAAGFAAFSSATGGLRCVDTVVLQEMAELINMRLQASKFYGDIEAQCEKRGLLRYTGGKLLTADLCQA